MLDEIDEAVNWELIRRSKKFEALDVKLGRELMDLVKSYSIDFFHDIMHKETDLMALGKMLPGRQIMWMINDHFSTSAQKAHLMETQDFMNFKYDGKQLERFITDWRRMVRTLNFVPTESFLEEDFLENIKKDQSNDFRLLLNMYSQDVLMGQSKPSYAQLLTFCEIEIAERRRDSVRRAHEKQAHKLAYTSSAGMCPRILKRGKCPKSDCPYRSTHDSALFLFDDNRRKRRDAKRNNPSPGDKGSRSNSPKESDRSPRGEKAGNRQPSTRGKGKN